MASYIKIYTFDHSELPKLQLAVTPKTNKAIIKEMFIMRLITNLKRNGSHPQEYGVNINNVMKFITGVRMSIGKVYTEDFFGRIGE